MRYPAILAAALCAATALAAPAAAAPASVAVKYSDLDLSTAAGQAQLESRIDKAARSVCATDRIPTGSHVPTSASRECYKEARARVHEQVAEKIARDNSRG